MVEGPQMALATVPALGGWFLPIVEGRRPLSPDGLEFTRSVLESKALNDRKGPLIVISASGMATGGRVIPARERWVRRSRRSVSRPGSSRRWSRP